MYINSRNQLKDVEKLIREEASQKDINKAFKKFQKIYLACNLEYKKEKSVMVEVDTQKQPRKKKSKEEVVKLGDGLEMSVRHIGKDTAVLDLFRDGKRVVK